MSKTSHERHEHKEHPHHHREIEEEIPPNFASRHKTFMWIIIIVFAIAGPLLFAALSVLGIFR